MKLYYTIDEILKEDGRWRKLAYSITGNNQMEGDELLSIFYLYYLEMPSKPIINHSYIHRALYQIHVQRQMKLIKRVNYEENDDDTDELINYSLNVEQDHYLYDDTDDVTNDNLYKSVLLDVEGLDYFNRTLFKLNMIDGMSIRKIQKEYKLSYSTIQKSIANTKQLIKNKYTDNEQK